MNPSLAHKTFIYEPSAQHLPFTWQAPNLQRFFHLPRTKQASRRLQVRVIWATKHHPGLHSPHRFIANSYCKQAKTSSLFFSQFTTWTINFSLSKIKQWWWFVPSKAVLCFVPPYHLLFWSSGAVSATLAPYRFAGTPNQGLGFVFCVTRIGF